MWKHMRAALDKLTDPLAGLRYFVPDHKLPHRRDVEAQAGRLYHPIHGGRRQGNFGDEALPERKSPFRG